jgi:hypothetical protein
MIMAFRRGYGRGNMFRQLAEWRRKDERMEGEECVLDVWFFTAGGRVEECGEGFEEEGVEYEIGRLD